MNESDAVAFYVRMVAAQVRAMPLREAVPFLKGALAVAGDHAAMAPLRGTYADLTSADDQLELLAGPQLRLPLDGKDGAQ